MMAGGKARTPDAGSGHRVWVRRQGGGAEVDVLLDRAPEARLEGAGAWQVVITSR